jgi:hypothetical protein
MATNHTSDPSACVALDFQVTNNDAGACYRPPTVPTVDLGVFDVPLSGISTGSSMYVWFSTNCMSTSLLARSDDDSKTFTRPIYTLSDCGCGAGCKADPFGPKPIADSAACVGLADCHFVNVQAQVVPASQAQGLPGYDPAAPSDQLVLFGSGAYRRSDVYLATAPLAQIERKSALRYFTGIDPVTCLPAFGASEALAAPIFGTGGESAAGAASAPWGPYSKFDTGAVVLNPRDGAYCSYIYKADAGCDGLSDPRTAGGGNNGPGDTGGVYGAYAIPRYTVGTEAGAALTFVVSTHNPYNTMLLRTELAAP